MATSAVSVTGAVASPPPPQDIPFLPLLFETASAFGGVGPSRGATGEPDDLGRTIICAIMFPGRVGPLTPGFFLAVSVAPRVRYPAAEIHPG